jgi:hypothetical protein
LYTHNEILIELDTVFKMWEYRYRHAQQTFSEYCEKLKEIGYRII